MSKPAITLHGVELSGHTHRVEMLLKMLGLPYRYAQAPADVRRTEAFLKLNPLGQIPVLEDGDLVLSDSNAILVYLVRRYAPESRWLPNEPVAAAEVQRFLSIAAGELRFGPAAARVITLFGAPGDRAACRAIATRILTFMEAHTQGREWLVGENPTIADLACYSYIAHAPEGGVMLEPYPAVQAWLRRVEALPNFKPLPASAIPQVA